MLDCISTDAAPVLIHATGRLDESAIAAEIARQMEGAEPHHRHAIEREVREVASKQSWPLRCLAIGNEWTDAEHAEYFRLLEVARTRPVSFQGNIDMERIYAKADAIRFAVEARAKAKIDQPEPILMQAAE